MKTVAFCEIEEFACKVLNKNFPHIPIHKDVRKTDEFTQYTGRIDLLTGGYPCQPFSVAGKQKAEEDPRHLWPSMFEIIKQVRPTWILAENVAGHIRLGLDKVLTDLEGEGYASRAIVVPACAVEAPHRRDRVWIIANTKSQQSSCSVQRDSSKEEQGEPRRSVKQGVSSNTSGIRSQEQRKHRGRLHSKEDEEGKEYRTKHGNKFEIPWVEAATKLCRVDDGLSSRLDKFEKERLKGLGNAIVPQVAYEIMKAIIETEKKK